MTDTIAAIATATGRAGIGVVRVSGPDARYLGEQITGGSLQPRVARHCAFLDADGEPVDHGIALYFAAPASFTGEDVLELQGHGGAVVMQLVLSAVLNRGARLAQPGEFTERSFVNGKMDLAQAEAVADLIAGRSEAAVRGALRSLRGEFSEFVNSIDEEVLALRVYVEAAIDFPDEEVELLSDGAAAGRVAGIRAALEELLESSRRGVVLAEGITVALLGAPNVGKSSVLNALAAQPRAIVTELPGTTRDLIHAPLEIGGLAVTLVDTAGLRDTDDAVEQEGVRRAVDQARQADVVLLVRDLSAAPSEDVDETVLGDAPRLVVENKVDLTELEAGPGGRGRVRVSALTGAGIDALRQSLLEQVGYAQETTTFTARERHLRALGQARKSLDRATTLVEEHAAAELVAEELRSVHAFLGEVVGETTSDALLGEIFSSFCIGK
tara:strand:+ start:10003 stop:11325 length:1323 start_codon:yes stop_codon:yes gene_type:complete